MESSQDDERRRSLQQQNATGQSPDTIMNLALSDPPRWGWTAAGTIADLLPPHERARRRATRSAFRKLVRQRSLAGTTSQTPVCVNAEAFKSPGVAPQAQPLSSSTVPSMHSTLPADKGEELAKSNMDKSVQMLPNLKSADPSKMKDETKIEIHGTAAISMNGRAMGKESGITSALDDSNKGGEENKTTEAPRDSTEMQNGTVAISSDPTDATMGGRNMQETSQVDTMKLFGVQHEFLGMDIVKEQASTEGNGVKGKERYNCRVKTISDEGVLDMYSYHRGREGYELRDPQTGDLKCPCPATDTNHALDAQRLDLKVVVNFSLQFGGGGTENSTSSMYRETIDWDLTDPTTPSPAVFANQIANEFGLSYGQMVDLAMSIELQINAHMQQNCNYAAPLSVADPLGNERRPIQAIQTHRFGQTLRLAEGGVRMKTTDNQRSISRAPSVHETTTNTKKRKMDERATDDIDDAFVEEVKRRARAESVLDIASKCTNGNIGLMKRQDAEISCHVCRKVCDVSFRFACGNSNHVYCYSHCKLRLDEGFNSEFPISSYCPICSMTCTCQRCTKKARTIAIELKATKDAQGTSLEKTEYDGLIAKGRNLGSMKSGGGKKKRPRDLDEEFTSTPGRLSSKGKGSQRKTKVAGAKQEGMPHLMVSKTPLSDFPREIIGTVEIDRATVQDYLTVYTANGNYVVDHFPEVWLDEADTTVEISDSAPANGVIIEDGNVDYCQTCRSHGNLICCDYCPRAFHLECIEVQNRPRSDSRWECMVCKKEACVTDDDLVDVEKALATIVESFERKEIKVDREAKETKALSAIYSMISKLLDYDFGYMFENPVDASSIPGYKDIVKNPMDLGSIAKSLANGDYAANVKADAYKAGQNFLENPVIAVLKDIELVWHNCLLFNMDGSAIHRMASVQRRRAHAIQLRSYDTLLSENVKTAVTEYVKTCENARKAAIEQQGQFSPLDSRDREMRALKPKGKHKITTKAAKPKVNRPVAIVDGSTGRLVKTYTSVKSAFHAALSISSLGYRCEQFPNYENVKNSLLKSKHDPSVKFFGYRWVFLDDLREGKVAFGEIPFNGFQVHQNGETFTFASLDEALSFISSRPAEPVHVLSNELSSLKAGCGWTHVSGNMWRRLQCPPLAPRKGSEDTPDIQATTSPQESMEKAIFASCSYIKKDIISGRILCGYSSLRAAHADWKRQAGRSPLFPPPEDKSVESFSLRFMDGNRDIDGIIWKSQTPSRVDPEVPGTTIDGTTISQVSTVESTTSFDGDNEHPAEIPPTSSEPKPTKETSAPSSLSTGVGKPSSETARRSGIEMLKSIFSPNRS